MRGRISPVVLAVLCLLSVAGPKASANRARHHTYISEMPPPPAPLNRWVGKEEVEFLSTNCEFPPAASIIGYKEQMVVVGSFHSSSKVVLNHVNAGNSGPAVICIHSLLDSWRTFSRLLPTLPAHAQVYALDLRGHGKSSKVVYDPSNPRMNPYTMEANVQDILGFMKTKGISSASFIGHGFGAMLALQLAHQHPAKVDKLVLIGMTSGDTPQGNQWLQGCDCMYDMAKDILNITSRDDSKWPHWVGQYMELASNFKKLPIWAEQVSRWSLMQPPIYVVQGLLPALLGMDVSNWGPAWGLKQEELTAIQKPVLLIRGADDTLSSSEDNKRVCHAMPNCLGTFEVPHTSHPAHLEAPETVLRELLVFLIGTEAVVKEGLGDTGWLHTLDSVESALVGVCVGMMLIMSIFAVRDCKLLEKPTRRGVTADQWSDTEKLNKQVLYNSLGIRASTLDRSFNKP